MDRKSFENQSHLEENYWWFIGRRKIILNLIEKYFKTEKANAVALDAGCGTGIMLPELERYARTVGLDHSEVAIDYVKKHTAQKILRGNISDLPFENRSFDLIAVLGVLYNRGIEDDDQALKEFFRVLKKDGIIVVDEAAYKFLQSKHNIEVDGIRRYTRRQLISKLKRCGFRILRASYWNVLMLPVFYIITKLDKCLDEKRQFARLQKIPYLLNTILRYYLYLEAFMIKYIDFPFGPSIIVVAKK